MTQAFAAKMPRGFSWVWLAIVAVALSPIPSSAQFTIPGKDDKKPPVEQADDDAPDPAPTEQVFVDPNAKKALTVFSPMTYQGPAIKVRIGGTGDDRSLMQNMAARATNIDPEFIKRYIEFFTVELTRRENLNAVLNPPTNQKASDAPARALERAVDALNKPIIDGRANDNREFLAVYYRTLFESNLPKLLESNHNYLSRIDAMIVLGMAGNPGAPALDLYTAQLKKPDQLVWVKLWAARGITIAAQNGEINLEATKANLAAEALIGFLESDPKLPWPAQMRAIEALGSLRIATANLANRKIDAASVVMKYLSDPEGSTIVRAWSAWAIGMMKVPASVSPYNFSLAAQKIGELAVDLGNRIVQEFDDNPATFDKEKDGAAKLTGLLIFQVCPSLIGVEKVSESGLLRSPHRNAVDARPLLTKFDDKIKAVSRQAYELLKTAGAGNKPARDQLDAKLADLKTLLAATTVKDRRLVPGGPEFPPNPAQVAGAARH